MEEVRLVSAESSIPQNKITNLKKRKKWKPVQWMCFGIALIPILSFLVFSGFPVVISFVAMFTNMRNNVLATMEWNSFDNFRVVFTDDAFWKSWTTTFWLAGAQLVSLCISLLIAVLLEKNTKGAKAMQVFFFVPYICSTAAIAIMWSWIFKDGEIGLLNTLFGTDIDWLFDIDHPYRLVWCVFITIVWQAPAYGIVMFKAALRNINPSLYEAADIDGANGFSKFWYITLPGIKAVTLFLLLAGITGGLAVFDSVLILAPLQFSGVAGPENVGLTVNYYIYLHGVAWKNMQYGAVASWALFIVTFLISFPIIRARNKAAEE